MLQIMQLKTLLTLSYLWRKKCQFVELFCIQVNRRQDYVEQRQSDNEWRECDKRKNENSK